MKKLILLTALLTAFFTVYKLYPFNKEEAKVQLVSEDLSIVQENNQTVSDPSKKDRIEAHDFKTDLERIWFEDDKSVPVASYLEELISEVQNDNPYAKYHLSYLHRFCSDAAINEEHLETQLTKIKQENRKNFLTDKFIYCEGFPKKMLTTKDVKNLIIQAARSGNPKAKLEFAAVAFDLDGIQNTVKNAEQIVDLKKEAMQHYMDAKNMGEEDALYWLGMAFKNGELTHQDDIEAYAYLSALSLVDPTYSLGTLRLIEENLTQEQIELATKRGENYAKCCL